MSNYNKVVWSEGMFIRPQHFQQQDRYIENYINQRCRTVCHYPWGLSHSKIDQSLLSIGKFSLAECSGVFPDGTPFAFPLQEQAPDPLEVAVETSDSLVYLALPLQRMGSVEFSNGDHAQPMARYQSEVLHTTDQSASMLNSAMINVGRLRLRLILDTDDLSQYAAIPIARIIGRRDNGKIVLDENFIAPSLDCHGNQILAGYLGELTAILQHRGKMLASQMGNIHRSQSLYYLKNFLQLQVMNYYQATLEHLLRTPLLHPEQLYVTMAQLRAELATFSETERQVTSAVPYNHNSLQRCFTALMQELRITLNTLQEPLADRIELEMDRFGIQIGVIHNRALLENARLVLSAQADYPADTLINELPRLIKIGPVEQIRQLINLQLPGLSLRQLPVAPTEIPYHPQSIYFSLDTGDAALWQKIKETSSIALHISGELPRLDLSLWLIKE